MTIKSESLSRAILYGGGSVLLLFDLFFLIKATATGNFIPLVPIIAGIFTAAGLLFVVYAEHQARELDKEDHRRISRVAHQLEAPLHALETDLTHLIAQANNLPAEARLKLKRMETKNKTLLENIRDVFFVLRALQGSIAQEKRVYDLCALVRDVIKEQQPLAQACNVEITHQERCENAQVALDRRLFAIALTHLIENGMRYTLTPGLVNIVVAKDVKKVRVIVQDRGVGIAASDRQVIFQPFARGRHADQFDPDGIGVGVTLARLIAREFGGDVHYASRGAKTGSQFEIILPLAKKKII